MKPFRFTPSEVSFLRENELGLCPDCCQFIAEVAPDAVGATCDLCDSTNVYGVNVALERGAIVAVENDVTVSDLLACLHNRLGAPNDDPQKMTIADWPEVER